MNKALLLVAVFSFGYVCNDILRENSIDLVEEAQAEVAGMDYRALRRDRDFKRAVRYIVNGCNISGGYVGVEHLYIDC